MTMRIEETRIEEMTYEKFRELIRASRRSMELRMLGILMRPRNLTAADDAELGEMRSLLAKYDELMDEKYWRNVPHRAANDSNWSDNK